jgi:N-hydroxyarylamine O-acetyltransferase
MLTDSALARYCTRIACNGPLNADLATLQQLHACHPQAIPFENLDAWLGLPVSLEPDRIFDKLVIQRRGGYCFEHNLLFRRVLQTLGFSVQGLAARVRWQLPANSALPRTHMLLLVSIAGERYVADAGFGGLTMTSALALDSTGIQHSPHEPFRITREAQEYVIHAELGDRWLPLYGFSLEPQTDADYLMANWFVSTHPQSRFVQQLIAARVDQDGRHALLNRRHQRHYAGQNSEVRELMTPAHLRQVLEEQLQIDTARLPGLDAKLATLFLETNE